MYKHTIILKICGIFVHNFFYMNEIDSILNQQNGIITSSQVKALGRGVYYKFLSNIKNGDFAKLKNGVYIKNDALANPMINFNLLIPKGVLCLYSAWFHYGLTINIPDGFYVATPKDVRITVPEFPPFIIMRWGEPSYSLGITNLNINGIPTKIYDREKCVCDAIKYRNKTGGEVTNEVVRNYLSLPDRNLPKLEQYSKQLRVYQALKPYLDINI